MSLSEAGREFRWNSKGEYHNFPPSTTMRRKKAINRSSGPGKLCLACGLTRSMTNKCECNS